MLFLWSIISDGNHNICPIIKCSWVWRIVQPFLGLFYHQVIALFQQFAVPLLNIEPTLFIPDQSPVWNFVRSGYNYSLYCTVFLHASPSFKNSPPVNIATGTFHLPLPLPSSPTQYPMALVHPTASILVRPSPVPLPLHPLPLEDVTAGPRHLSHSGSSIMGEFYLVQVAVGQLESALAVLLPIQEFSVVGIAAGPCQSPGSVAKAILPLSFVAATYLHVPVPCFLFSLSSPS